MMKRVQRPTKGRPYVHRGMTLIEVLVAILILSFGLLGFVGLQARAIQYSVGAEDSTRAALLANEIVATMELYQTVTPPTIDYNAWQSRVADPTVAGLANGAGEVTSSVGTGTATITVKWLPPSAASGAAYNQYTTQFVLAQ